MNTITHLKNRLGYWALLVMTFAIAACSDDKEESPEVQGKTTFDVEDIVFVSEKGEQETTFSFEAGNEWTASFSEGGSVFFSASQTKGSKGKAEITIQPLRTNLEAQVRTAEFRISVVGDEMVYVAKISQLGKGANLVVDTESLVLEADNVGEYFVDTLTVSSDQTWELTDATSGILFSFIDEHQSGQITTKKVEVKVLFTDFESMVLEGGFNIKAGATLKHISVKATAECKAYLTEEMDAEVEKLELLIDPATPGVYMAPLYVSSNIQWKLELPEWLSTPQPTNITVSGTLATNPLYVEVRIADGMIPASEKEDVIILSDVRSKQLIIIPIHFAGISDDYINHNFEFPAFDPYGNDFAFDPIPGTARILELPFMIETGENYTDVTDAPFKLLLCKCVNGALERTAVHWATLRMGDSSKDKTSNGIYTKELYLVANQRGDEDDVNKLTSMGEDREAYLFIVPNSVSFDDLFEDPVSTTLKSQYIGSYIRQKNAFLEYKMSVTGIENGATITLPAAGETKSFDMLSDAVKIFTSRLDVTEVVTGVENPRTFVPNDVNVEFKMKDGVIDLTKFVLTVGKNKDKRDRVIKIEFKAFRGINPEDGSDNTFTMFTFYVKQPFQ